MQRTIRIQLQPNTETAEILTQTIEQYTWSFNDVCKQGWEQGLSNGTELHKATYYDHRTITGLPAQLVCAARVKATEALKFVKERKRKKAESCEVYPGEPSPGYTSRQGGFPPSKLSKKEVVSCPQSKFCAIRYDARSYTVWFDRQELTLLTLNGRITAVFR